MTFVRFAWVLGWAGLAAIAGCVPGELHLAGNEDGSVDATLDARGDTADRDDSSRSDAMHDTGSSETAPIEDVSPAPPDGGPLPPVYCGSSKCPVPSDICCVRGGLDAGSPKYACQDSMSSSIKSCKSLGGTPASCGVGADCPGNVCCGLLNSSDTAYLVVQCQSTCVEDFDAGDLNVVFCDPSLSPDECTPIGKTCAPSILLPGFNVCGPL